MGKKLKYAAGATALAGAGALAYKKWQEDEQFQKNVQQAAHQAGEKVQSVAGTKKSEEEQSKPEEEQLDPQQQFAEHQF